MSDYPWYDVVHGPSLEQGDVFRKFPVFIPPVITTPELYEEGAEGEVDIELTDVMILTQSCDLDRDKMGNVLLAPIYSLSDFVAKVPKATRRSLYGELKAGRKYSAHILDRCNIPDHESDFTVVNFAMATTVAITTLEAFANSSLPRLRLLSPYREQMSQAFGRFIMRVGLPNDLTPLTD